MRQTVLTFLAKVNRDKISDLRTLLEGMAHDVERNTLIPFPKLKLLHFASLVVDQACLRRSMRLQRATGSGGSELKRTANGETR